MELCNTCAAPAAIIWMAVARIRTGTSCCLNFEHKPVQEYGWMDGRIRILKSNPLSMASLNLNYLQMSTQNQELMKKPNSNDSFFQ